MLPAEILRQVRRIEITTDRIVNAMTAGRYESVFKGHGIEFEEVREYQPGDEIRSIDWNVTARTGRPHIKRFVEERELTVVLVVDLSRSMRFGSAGLKHRIAAELCAILAFSAIKNHDKVGLALFTDRVERYLPPKKGRRHVLRVVRDILSFEPSGIGTDAAGALAYVTRVLSRPAVVFLVSDFYPSARGAASGRVLAQGSAPQALPVGLHTLPVQRAMAVANGRHDVIGIHLTDPAEAGLIAPAWLQLRDAEGSGRRMLNLRDRRSQDALAAWAEAHRTTVRRTGQAARVDVIEISTGRPYLPPLLQFFATRARRR